MSEDSPLLWGAEKSAEEWRVVFLSCLGYCVPKSCSEGAADEQDARPPERPLDAEREKPASDWDESDDESDFDGSEFDAAGFYQEARAAFCDGVNTGYYVNSYTTKHCPTMEGVLEQLRSGLERMMDSREQRRAELKEKLERQQAHGEEALSEEEQRTLKSK